LIPTVGASTTIHLAEGYRHILTAVTAVAVLREHCLPAWLDAAAIPSRIR
jgi:hypothetical protein